MRPEETLQLKRLLLIVDDQEINRDLLGMILESEFDLIYAQDGVEAMEQIMLHKDTLSAVLLDLVMPRMGGFEVLDALKGDPDLSRMPVIVLTAEKDAELQALEHGASSFITKPFDAHEIILARVRNFVELAEGRRLIHEAERDPETGLFTRQFFFSYARQIEQFHTDWEMEEMVIRIERYNLIGELYGREFADSIVKKLAGQLAKRARQYQGIAGRVSPDTFYLFMRKHEGHENHIQETQELLNKLKKNLDIRLRIGMCDIEKDRMNIRRRFECAESVCSLPSNNHDVSLMIYDNAMHEKKLYQEQLITDLPRAIAEHELRPYFQPKYDITGARPKLVACEALIRWQHPDYGLIPPFHFIPLFESSGLIQKVDTFIWRESAKQLKKWQEVYGTDLKVSVNVSAKNMYIPGVEKIIMNIIDETGIAPGDLHLEITESVYTDDAERLIDIMKKLKELGYQFEMDDFGSGYSSLNMLSALPIDVLKMDMLFMRGLKEEDSREYRMIEIIQDIAKMLGVPVIAEGAETQEQIRLLKKIGCQIVQGYYFSKPVPASEFEKFIEKEIEERKKEAEG